jgi:hypothetical protein
MGLWHALIKSEVCTKLCLQYLEGRSGLRWENVFKMGLKGIEWEGMDWIHMAQDWTIDVLL